MKQIIVQFLRAIRLIYLIDYFRYLKLRVKMYKPNQAYQAAYPTIPLPPPYFIYETFRLDYQRYFEKGKESAEKIIDDVSNYVTLQNKSILEWGCGPGRIIRHFPQLVGTSNQYFASDYNEKYINWCNEHLKGIIFSKNELYPPLKYNDNQMDLVYAISIFTHLSEKAHQLWMEELLRVSKKNGILYISLHGEINKIKLLPHEQQLFDEGNLVVRGQVKEGHRMYVAYHPEVYVEKLIGNRATIIKHIKGVKKEWGLEQDIWILQKI